MASKKGNQKIAKSRKNFGKSIFNGKLEASIRPSELKKVRLRRGFTQINICQKLGIKQATFGAIESGKRPVNIDRATNISNLLGKKIEEIFYKDNEKYKVIK